MNAGKKRARQLAFQSLWYDGGSVCSSNRENIFRRRFAAAAAAVAEPQTQHKASTPSEAQALKRAYQLRAGVVISRPPQVTRDLHPFEQAFYLYQRRLNERLALPFTRYFYFKKDQPAGIEFKRKMKQRLTPARDIGIYNAYGKEAWNDELIVGAPESDPHHQMEALVEDAKVTVVEEPGADELESGAETQKQSKVVEVEKPASRITEADKKKDQKSLERKLQNTLYLLVKDGQGRWRFPADYLIGRESLHRAAERVIVQAGGPDMNTWVVGNAPVGHFAAEFSDPVDAPEKKVRQLGEKVFFMKARIMAGQAKVEGAALGYTDFKWLSKAEIQQIVEESYWSAIKNMLVER